MLKNCLSHKGSMELIKKMLKFNKNTMVRKIRITILLLLVAISAIAQDIPQSYDFTENKGQWDDNVLYKGVVADGAFYLTKTGFKIVQYHAADLKAIRETIHSHKYSDEGGPIFIPKGSEPLNKDITEPALPQTDGNMRYRAHAIEIKFLNANAQIQTIPEKAIGGISNYFIGNDPSKWASDVKTYTVVTYKNVYPNIDIRFISAAGGLKYDFIVHPGGNPRDIELEIIGAENISLKKNQLHISSSVRTMIEDIPSSYVTDAQGQRKAVDCKYELNGSNRVKFKINHTDKQKTLVIDPSLVFSSFTGSAADQYGYTATPGYDGSLFSGGIAWGPGFPVSNGAFQSSFSNEIDIAIFRFNSTGSQRMYATYIGGRSREYPHSLIADQAGNLFILGRTNSGDFPATQVGSGGGFDILAIKLNPNGSALIGSLKIGGSSDDGVNIADKFVASGTSIFNTTYRFYGDDSRSEVILKSNGNVLITSQTQSQDFPIQGSTFQTSSGGRQDGIVAELDANCQSVVWSSYLGGSNNDASFVLTEHPLTGNIYIAGSTSSPDLPAPRMNAYTADPADGFITVISPNGTNVIRTKYFGTSRFDGIYGIQVDREGDIYIMGIAEGGYDKINANYDNAGSKQYVGKLDPDLNDWIFRTVFGSGSNNANISPVAFMVDRCQNMYVAGWGDGEVNTNISPAYQMAGTFRMPFTADAIKSQTDNKDLYFIVIEKNANSLLYATFYGQNGGYTEHVDGGTSRFDSQGVIYMAVCANCMRDSYPNVRFPTSVNAWSRVNGSSGCNLAAIKISFNYTGVAAGLAAYNERNVYDTIGCAPFTVELRDTILLAKSYIWQFEEDGDTTHTTDSRITHTFSTPGTYRVRLIAIDTQSCNEYDTAYINIHVSDDRADVAFGFTRGDDCTRFEYTFTNNSVAPPGVPFQSNTFLWNFGDGTTRIASADEQVTHTYQREGNYRVSLMLIDDRYCNTEEPEEIELRVTMNVVAQFATSPGGCVPYTASFRNISMGGINFAWDFGDGNTSTETSPTHTYNQVGFYTVTLTAWDEFTCNKVDQTQFTIEVSNGPVSNFTFTPLTPAANVLHTFYNESTGGHTYLWNFGDGNTRNLNNTQPFTYEYLQSGTYEVQLITLNALGCADTATRTVTAIVEPAFDVPNAFTPGRNGENSIIKVRGYGILNMHWVIYNRWGQRVFETRNKDQGWDGTFNGKLQPMDVYTYTLELTLISGEQFRRTGDITLIR